MVKTNHDQKHEVDESSWTMEKMKRLTGWWERERKKGRNPGPFDGIDPVSRGRFQQSISVAKSLALTHFFHIGGDAASYVVGATFARDDSLFVVRLDERPTLLVQQNLPLDVVVKGTAEVNRKEIKKSEGRIDVSWDGPTFASQAQFLTSRIIGGSHLQSVSRGLALGFRIFHSLSTNASAVQFAGRYTARPGHAVSVVTSSYGHYGISYFHRISPNLSTGVDCTLSLPEESVSEDAPEEEPSSNQVSSILKRVESFVPVWRMSRQVLSSVNAKIGYRYVGSLGSVRGFASHAGVVGMLVEEKLSEMTTLLISGELDHRNDAYRFGVGLQIG